jgi:hypothetical protein
VIQFVLFGLLRLTGVLSVVAGFGVIGASMFLAVREWRWDRDRSRRIRSMRERELENVRAAGGWAEAIARQLDEIRALPEVLEPRR